MSHPFLFSDLTLTIIKTIIVTLLSIGMFVCTEEDAVKIPEPLPETTLQFQSSTLTILEGHKAGLCGELVPVVILASEAPISPTLYYVIMKYKFELREQVVFPPLP